MRALDDASLTVERGETVVLVGESGSGKTTLLRLFNRLEVATSGEVLVAGEPVDVERSDRVAASHRLRAAGRRPAAALDGRAQRRAGAGAAGVDAGAQARAHGRSCSSWWVCRPRPTARAIRASSRAGQRQRVAFARAIAADPSVVLLDEPFGALDAITRLELHDEFLRLKNRLGKTFLLVTHDLREAFRLADRIAVMKSGRVLQVARPAELEREPADAYVARLLELTTGVRGCGHT